MMFVVSNLPRAPARLSDTSLTLHLHSLTLYWHFTDTHIHSLAKIDTPEGFDLVPYVVCNSVAPAVFAQKYISALGFQVTFVPLAVYASLCLPIYIPYVLFYFLFFFFRQFWRGGSTFSFFCRGTFWRSSWKWSRRSGTLRWTRPLPSAASSASRSIRCSSTSIGSPLNLCSRSNRSSSSPQNFPS